ncbi:helix-turn-helix domain-containing protein [Clostridium sp. AWRP]|uniref:helix-turn-helix domain-containing protein n=1 Tax=Clostridium sp. AWRP TaxID=2212991 RepID=UPI000FD7D54C|nr:helix-turn-helix domain-containing protein [Clostridium sp. AWRP]AZV56461.1 helix-turn-helix domain-containing protein [Clostridium sp. AWRP]
MILEKQKKIISPKQPYFVMNSSRYYKAVVMNYGISHFYAFYNNGSMDSSVFAIPDGCIDMYFCCDEKEPNAYICGTVFHPQVAFTERNKYLFGVRFLPGNCIKFKNAHMSSFVESKIPFLDVIEDRKLVEDITSSRNFNHQIKLFMDRYLKLYYNSKVINKHEDLDKFLISNIIKNLGQIKIKELANETNYSVRYINKIFLQEFGLTPKVFSKMMRFQNLLSNLNNLELNMFNSDLTEIAIRLGYYDQSHMIKDFKQFTNTTPNKYIYSLKKTDYNNKLIII